MEERATAFSRNSIKNIEDKKGKKGIKVNLKMYKY